MNYRVYEWYQILEQDIDYVWRPDILFQKVIDTKILPMYGNEEIFQMWFNTKDNHMEHYQAIKVTFACDYDFQHFPFDSHNCDFDFGMGSQVYNKTANFGPVEILNMDSKTELLNFEKEKKTDLSISICELQEESKCDLVVVTTKALFVCCIFFDEEKDDDETDCLC